MHRLTLLETLLDIGDTITRDNSETTRHVCPHWDPGKRACLLNKEGLFLPVKQHVDAYCLSSQHAACQYLLHLGAPEDGTGVLNRRQFIRIPSRHVFRFSEITGHDEVPGRSQDDAWTLDLGIGGLRFVSRVPLPVQAAVHFFLEGDSVIASITGTGRVAWSEPIEKTFLFHIGLVFFERSVAESSCKGNIGS